MSSHPFPAPPASAPPGSPDDPLTRQRGPAAGGSRRGAGRSRRGHGSSTATAACATPRLRVPEDLGDYELTEVLRTAYSAVSDGDRRAAAETIGRVLRCLDRDECQHTALLVELVIVWAFTMLDQRDPDVTAWIRWAQATASQRRGPIRQGLVRARLSRVHILFWYGCGLVTAAQHAELAEQALAAGNVPVWVQARVSRAVALHTAGRCQDGIDELVRLAAGEPRSVAPRPHSDYLEQLAAMYTACHRYRKAAKALLLPAGVAAGTDQPRFVDDMATPFGGVDQLHWLVCEQHRPDLHIRRRSRSAARTTEVAA